MTIGIIIVLEIIDIDHEQAEEMRVPPRPPELLSQELTEMAIVIEASEPVNYGQGAIELLGLSSTTRFCFAKASRTVGRTSSICNGFNT